MQNQNHNALTIIEMQLAVGTQMQQNFMTENKHHVINEYKQITRYFDQTAQAIHGMFKV